MQTGVRESVTRESCVQMQRATDKASCGLTETYFKELQPCECADATCRTVVEGTRLRRVGTCLYEQFVCRVVVLQHDAYESQKFRMT